MTAARVRGVVVAALMCGAGVVALVLASDHQEATTVWVVLGPVVGWSFVATGLYAWRRRRAGWRRGRTARSCWPAMEGSRDGAGVGCCRVGRHRGSAGRAS